MSHSYITEDIESFYFLIGLLVSSGFKLDFDYMQSYLESNQDKFLVLVMED